MNYNLPVKAFITLTINAIHIHSTFLTGKMLIDMSL